MIDYDALKSFQFEPVVQSYSARDTMLYALGLNIGADPLDPEALQHVAVDPPVPVVTMPMTLARLGPWMSDPKVGIDYRKIVVGEVDLRVHAPLSPTATVVAEHRVIRVTDKGEGRGALVTVQRRLTDQTTGQLLAEYEQVTFCRADGGFARDGRHDPPPPAPEWSVGERAPDVSVSLPTSPQQALIYRLSGDMNPLHADPKVAHAAGFERPILHGLATLGMAGHALDRLARGSGGTRLNSLRARLSAPVLPGETLRLEGWCQGAEILFRVVNTEGRDIVSLGRAALS